MKETGHSERALVTIVIPVFNPGTFLERALASAAEQTEPRWHAIVVDDGGWEDLSWVEGFDRRVHLIRQQNAGVSAARNAALRRADSDFVAFLDQDDLWYPRKLSAQLAVMIDHPQIGLVSTDFEIIDERGVIVSEGYRGYCQSYGELLRGNGIAASTVMIRRNVLDDVGMLNEAYRQADDWDLWLRIAHKHPIMRLHEPLAGYRLHDSNVSRNYVRTLREGLMILKAHERKALIDHRVNDAVAAREGQKRLRRLVGSQAFDAFRVNGQLRHLFYALRLAPRYTTGALARYAARVAQRKNTRTT
jgi:glycosyltransferase involved in cell wall biosynthesis